MSSVTCFHAVRMVLGETESGVFCLNARRLCSPCHLSGFGGGDQLVRRKRNDVVQARHDYATMGPVTRKWAFAQSCANARHFNDAPCDGRMSDGMNAGRYQEL